MTTVRVSPQMSQYQCHCIRGFIFIVAGEPIVSPQMSQSLPSYSPRTQYTTSSPPTNLCAQRSHYCPMYMHANIFYLSNWYLNIALRAFYLSKICNMHCSAIYTTLNENQLQFYCSAPESANHGPGH